MVKTMKHKRSSQLTVALAASSLVLLAACAGPQDAQQVEEIGETLDEPASAEQSLQLPDHSVLQSAGSQYLLPFKKALKQTLTTAIAEGGPVNAVSACNLEAAAIAQAVSVDGVEVGRSSHKLRNPMNAPQPWMAGMLEAWAAGNKDVTFGLADLDNNRVGYAEPIYAGAQCLVCHGQPEQIPEAVQQKLASLYPDDQATGFSAGDFRGIFWVMFERPVAE